MSLFELAPMPTQHNFDEAFVLMDSDLQAEVGPVLITGGESALAEIDEEAKTQDEMISAYSTFFVSYDADGNDLNAHRPAHAFSRGYALTHLINNMLYDNRYEFRDYFGSLNEWMASTQVDTIEDERKWFEAARSLVENYSETGLALLGSRSIEAIDEWADRLFIDTYLARTFKLGCGAMVLSGVIHHRSVIDWTISSENFSDEVDAGLSELLSGNQSGEGNNEAR